MNENKFEDLLLSQLKGIDNRMSRFEDKIEGRFNKIDDQMKVLENKVEDRFNKIEDRLGSLEQTTAWIKGKLEGRGEMHHVVLTGISILVAIGAVVVAIFK